MFTSDELHLLDPTQRLCEYDHPFWQPPYVPMFPVTLTFCH